MIDPPSVPVIRTACVTTVCSTSSRSRIELTASPTSRRDSSSSTFVASSAVRDSDARSSATFFSAIAAWAAKASITSVVRSSKGATSLRHSERTPTTSSSDDHRSLEHVR